MKGDPEQWLPPQCLFYSSFLTKGRAISEKEQDETWQTREVHRRKKIGNGLTGLNLHPVLSRGSQEERGSFVFVTSDLLLDIAAAWTRGKSNWLPLNVSLGDH